MTSTTQTPTVRWRLLGSLMLTITVAGLIGLVFATGLAVIDMADTTDDWHGMMLIVAAWVGGPSAVATLLGSLGGRRVRRRDPSARGFAILAGLLLLTPLLLTPALGVLWPLPVLGVALLVAAWPVPERSDPSV